MQATPRRESFLSMPTAASNIFGQTDRQPPLLATAAQVCWPGFRQTYHSLPLPFAVDTCRVSSHLSRLASKSRGCCTLPSAPHGSWRTGEGQVWTWIAALKAARRSSSVWMSHVPS